jgi:hypothetical protein
MKLTMRRLSLKLRPSIFALCFSALLLVVVAAAFAQESTSRLVISSADSSSAPTILLRAYGMDGQGNPLVLDPSTVSIQHAGQPVTSIEVAGEYEAGTFTVFVVDVPPGVESLVPTIQQIIEQYASPPNMKERADYLAVYQVGETAATQLLAPTNFYNSVRNFFAAPLEVQTGPTALVDSLAALLGEIETLKPKSDMAASIVVLTDGTDVVSTQVDPEELGRQAAELGIPIDTIWLANQNLQPFSQEAGQQYLANLASQSRGLSARYDEEDKIQAIWDRIGAFRNHTVLQYTPQDLSAGQQEVLLSLQADPEVQARTTANISAAAPSVSLDLPPESRELTLESLDTPVDLVLSASVSWLDGVERELASAELIVNGVAVQDIDVRRLDRFTAEISNFNYGPNTLQVAIVDELGQRGTSPIVTLTIDQGATEVPEDIQAGGLFDSPIFRVVLGCLIVLFVLALFALVATLVGRRRRARRQAAPIDERGASYRQPPAPAGSESSYGQPEAADGNAVGSGTPYLEVLESVTRMPPIIELTGVEHRIGRSPVQSDIVFENDITVSRIHASIVLEGNDYRIYDEGSTSGTWVNDQPVPEYGHQLMDGDEIRLGAAFMRYRRH